MREGQVEMKIWVMVVWGREEVQLDIAPNVKGEENSSYGH